MAHDDLNSKYYHRVTIIDRLYRIYNRNEPWTVLELSSYHISVSTVFKQVVSIIYFFFKMSAIKDV